MTIRKITWQLVIDRFSRRIVTYSPVEGFVLPASVRIMGARGLHVFQTDECELLQWTGHMPPGMTPQTAFLFKLEDDGRITEIVPTTSHNQIIH
ncbi:hypothetical protein JI739_03720 [Ramlibacter sp. AW1]|uniref:Uncharacterized protein n=1 Tax=Ramlibacter aurantiacus TaxID=2801330 RepID=A0A937D266_9BURK|nr:hypothetical protein [Ramlibacter aurantiacus]MBL0419450.1 hypothetical protein [Ramlibacter aurantiacus]